MSLHVDFAVLPPRRATPNVNYGGLFGPWKNKGEIVLIRPGVQPFYKLQCPRRKDFPMKRAILFVVISIFLAFSCQEDTGPLRACSVENPVEDLDWLAAEIQKMEASEFFSQYFYVTQAKYGPKTVFIFLDCCPNCDSAWRVFDCSGNLMGYIGDIDESILDSDVVIWKSDNSTCVFQ
jgi:hypothetical protein